MAKHPTIPGLALCIETAKDHLVLAEYDDPEAAESPTSVTKYIVRRPGADFQFKLAVDKALEGGNDIATEFIIDNDAPHTQVLREEVLRKPNRRYIYEGSLHPTNYGTWAVRKWRFKDGVLGKPFEMRHGLRSLLILHG